MADTNDKKNRTAGWIAAAILLGVYIGSYVATKRFYSLTVDMGSDGSVLIIGVTGIDVLGPGSTDKNYLVTAGRRSAVIYTIFYPLIEADEKLNDKAIVKASDVGM